jgi:hypothetical protein
MGPALDSLDTAVGVPRQRRVDAPLFADTHAFRRGTRDAPAAIAARRTTESPSRSTARAPFATPAPLHSVVGAPAASQQHHAGSGGPSWDRRLAHTRDEE